MNDRKRSIVAGADLGTMQVAGAAAQAEGDMVSAGNGGVATGSSSGGAVTAGDLNSGGNAGNAVAVGDSTGAVGVDGGSVGNATTLDVSANGGTGIADASGGDYNLAFTS